MVPKLSIDAVEQLFHHSETELWFLVFTEKTEMSYS